MKSIHELFDVHCRIYMDYPTDSPPTMLISEIPLHRIKGTNAGRDPITKIMAFGKMSNCFLDTATMLDYLAILEPENEDHVTSMNLCPVTQMIS